MDLKQKLIPHYTCPHCGARYRAILGPLFSQPKTKNKFCPVCKQMVFVKFKASRFALALTTIVGIGGVVTSYVGAYGFAATFCAACTIPIALSAYLDDRR